MPVKSVLAAAFVWQRGKVIWQVVLTADLQSFFATRPLHNGRAKGGRIRSLALDCHHISATGEREWQTGKLMWRGTKNRESPDHSRFLLGGFVSAHWSTIRCAHCSKQLDRRQLLDWGES
jgi:hypothetical protein